MKPSSQQQQEESDKQDFEAARHQSGDEPLEEFKAEESSPLLQTTDEDTDAAQQCEGGDEGEEEPLSRAQQNENKWKQEADENLQKKWFGEGDERSPFAPPSERGCQDCWCTIVLFLFIGAMGFLTVYGLQNGDIAKLTSPVDAGNNLCGVDDYVDYPYMVLTDIDDLDVNQIFRSGLCVTRCPETKEETLLCKPNSVVTDCNVAADSRYESRAVVEFCLPVSMDEVPQLKQAWEMAKESFASSGIGSYFMDCIEAKNAIIISLFTAVLLSMFYIILMSYASEILAWICIGLTWVGLIGIAVGCWLMRSNVLEKIDMYTASNQSGDMSDLETLEKEATNYMIGCVAGGIMSGLYTCCVWCYWSDLETAINVVDASADFLADTFRIIFTPMFHFLLTFIVLLLWVAAMACVISMNDIEASTTFPQMKNLTWRDDVWYMSLFMFFGLLWLTALIDYINRFIVICSASTYYFNNKRTEALSDGTFVEQKPASVCKAWHIAYVNHIGSIAVGAFIIALIRLLKYTVVYLTQQLEKASAGSAAGAATQCIARCAIWVLELFERIVDYINETAYCYIAVTGDNFCTGALQGMFLKVKYMAMVAFATFLAKIFIFIGKVAIIVGNVFLMKFVMNTVTKEAEDVSSETGPMIVVAIITYLFVSMFIGMFDESVNAMLTCVAIDSNAHPDEGPQYGPETFRDRLDIDENGQFALKQKKKATGEEEGKGSNDMV